MRSKKIDSGFLLRLEKGEELVSTVGDFCKKSKISGGWITGLGGVTSVQVGYYHLKRQKYVWRHVKNVVELTNLTGNISQIGDEVILHLHATVTDTRNKAYGGHLREATTGGTVEIFIQTLGVKLTRSLDKNIGLPLLDL